MGVRLTECVFEAFRFFQFGLFGKKPLYVPLRRSGFGGLFTRIVNTGKLIMFSFPSRNTQHSEYLSSLQIELEYAVHW
jgi:hypothetical protein